MKEAKGEEKLQEGRSRGVRDQGALLLCGPSGGLRLRVTLLRSVYLPKSRLN